MTFNQIKSDNIVLAVHDLNGNDVIVDINLRGENPKQDITQQKIPFVERALIIISALFL